MALGKKNVNPGISNGMTPQPPSASPEKLDAFLDAVGTRLNQLQATVADLVERTAADAHQASVDPMNSMNSMNPMNPMGGFTAPAHGDSDVEAASRTLVLAQRTADTLLAEAREEAERLVSDAQAKSEAMLADARAAADSELGLQRAHLEAEQSRWEQLKADLSAGFTSLDDQIEHYVATLTGSHAAVKEVLRGFDIPAEIVVDEVVTSDNFSAPEFSAPEFSAPEFSAPEFSAPEFSAPDISVGEFSAASAFPAPPADGWNPPVTTEVASEAAPAIVEPVTESVNSMFGPRSTPLFSGQPTGWNNDGEEAAAPPVPEAPPTPEEPSVPTRRPGFFGQ